MGIAHNASTPPSSSSAFHVYTVCRAHAHSVCRLRRRLCPPAACDRLACVAAQTRPIALSPCLAPNTRPVSVQPITGSTGVMIYGKIDRQRSARSPTRDPIALLERAKTRRGHDEPESDIPASSGADRAESAMGR